MSGRARRMRAACTEWVDGREGEGTVGSEWLSERNCKGEEKTVEFLRSSLGIGVHSGRAFNMLAAMKEIEEKLSKLDKIVGVQ